MRPRAAALPAALLAALVLTSAAVLPAVANAEAVSLPSGAATGNSQNALIYQVACPAAGDCLGVGGYTDTSANNQALIDTESDGTWSSSNVAASTLPDAGSPPRPNLTGVACPSLGDCVAVDAYDDASDNEQGLIDTESGGAWTPSEAPLAGVQPVFSNPGVEVADVACPAIGACIGIGSYVGSDTYEHGLIEAQTPSGWSASEAPLPTATYDSSSDPNFYDVSCSAPGSCATVGYYTDSSGNQQGLLDTDAGGSWTATELDLSALASAGEPAATDPQASVTAVSCPSAGDCTAVGTYEDAAGAFVALQVSEVGGQWQAASALSLPGDASTSPDGSGDPIQNDLYVNGVSCSSAGDCTAVGSYDATGANDMQAFTSTEVAGAWEPGAETTLPSDVDGGAATNPQAALDSVTCQSAGDCLAAGTYEAAAGQTVALLARQSGGSWTTAAADLATPYDASLGNEYWASVACAPGGYCATGGYIADNESGLENAFMLDAPAAPTSVAATRSSSADSGSGGSEASVSWSAPTDTGGLPLSGFTITANDLTNPASGGQSVTVAASATSATVTGLAPDDSYSFAVTAASLLGNGLPLTSAGVSAAAAAAPQTGKTPPTGAAPTRAQIRASLAVLLKPHDLAASRRRLRGRHRYTLRYRGLEPGRLTVRWYYEQKPRHHRLQRILVASGTARATHAAQALVLTVRLTRAGRRVLSNDSLARLTILTGFTPVGATVVSRSATLP